MPTRRNTRRRNTRRQPAGSRALTVRQKRQVKSLAAVQVSKGQAIQMINMGANIPVGTILVYSSMLDELMTSILPNFNVATTSSAPLYQLPGSNYRKLRIKLTGIHFNMIVRGSSGGVILPADYFNNVRIRLAWFPTGYGDLSVHQAPGTVTDPFDTRDTSRVYFDKLFYLPTLTFDSSNNPVPSQRQFRKFFKINRIIEAFSDGPTSSTDWATKSGDLKLFMWSDSSLTPHPNVEYDAQLYYKFIM